MTHIPNALLFAMPGGTLYIFIFVMIFLGSFFLFTLYYLSNSTRRKTLPGRILKELVIVLLVWIVVTAILIPVGSQAPLVILFWICFFPFGYFLYLINLYWLIPAYEKKHKKKITYVLEQIPAAIIIAFPFLMIGSALDHYKLSLLIPLFLLAAVASCGISWFIYSRNKDKIKQLLYLRKELGRTTSSLQFLRSQINPHFLFNALNTLYGMALKENAVKTSDGIQRLGDMMRFMLRDNQKEMIPLSGEVSYIKDYIYIQQLRLADSANMKLSVNIREPEVEYAIVPMLLVPFVENAFKHGVRLQEKSWISLELYVEDGVLHFEVRNSMHADFNADTNNTSTGIGLENVKERLSLLYPQKHQLIIQTNQNEHRIQLTITL